MSFMDSDLEFDRKILDIYREIITQAKKNFEIPKKKKTLMDDFNSFATTVMKAYRMADQKTMLKIRQLIDTNIELLMAYCDPRCIDSLTLEITRHKFRDKIKASS